MDLSISVAARNGAACGVLIGHRVAKHDVYAIAEELHDRAAMARDDL